MAPRASLPALVGACLASVGLAQQRPLVQTTYSGHVVDFYCLSLTRTGGTAIDGSDVVLEPQEHTLHCLRDVPQCRDGFYLAEKDSSGEYQIKFQLDDESYTNVLALMDTFPKGSDRDMMQFTVTATGMHGGDGVLRGATFVPCFEATGCDSVCNVTGSGNCDTPADQDYTLPARHFLLVAHVVCMCLSWGCLLPMGVIWARNLRTSTWKPGGVPVWFQGHRTIQSIGVTLQLLGFLFIFLFKKGAHFQRPHEIIGLIVVLLGIMQPINAQIRHHKSIGHPGPNGEKTRNRVIWEFVHKGSGWLCLFLGMVNVILGPIHANDMRWSRGLVVASAVWVGISLGLIVQTGVILEVRRMLGLDCKCKDEPVEGPESPQMVGNAKE
jgi:hypothetical protein